MSDLIIKPITFSDDIKKLLNDLEKYRQWAEANIYEVPLALPDTLWQASEVINALLPMTAEKCSTCRHSGETSPDSVCLKCRHFAAKELIKGDFWELNITVPKYTEKNPYAGRRDR